MTPLTFYKMSGSGNDFIIIDNHRQVVGHDDLPRFAAQICRRKMSVGADGLILLEPSDKADFKWRFFNSNGSVAEMCGNGARCAARMAHMIGLAGQRLNFETLAGIIEAEVDADTVKVKMTDPGPVILDQQIDLEQGRVTYSLVNTGVPHVVIASMDERTGIPTDIDHAPVTTQGRDIRFHSAFAPAGTNVNYIAPADAGNWRIRTYERGVEDETLACGTGNVAAALVIAQRTGAPTPVTLITQSGSKLKVFFQKGEAGFHQVYLEGDARVIYTGELQPDAWQYDL